MEGIRMHLYLVHVMNVRKLSAYDFFRIAHIWRFKRDAPVENDVAQYKIHAIVPVYVQDYIKHIQENESCSALNATDSLQATLPL